VSLLAYIKDEARQLASATDSLHLVSATHAAPCLVRQLL